MRFEMPEIKELHQEVKQIDKKIDLLMKDVRINWISREEFCKEFGVSTSACRNYEDQKILKPARLGKKIFYRISDINTYFESQIS